MSDKNNDKNYLGNSAGSELPKDVKKAGILRKLKTMKKKYFVLRLESDNGPARLEYYDNEKKYRSSGTAKRSILIKTCFNINRKVDAKHKLAIALYTKDDCFSVVADSETSRDEWLNAMLELQLDEPFINGGAKVKPKYEHVWQVTVGDKSLASSRNMKGIYRLCLTPSVLALVKVDQTDTPETLEFPLMSIRRCGHTHNYFLIELGRTAITGAGELWMETEDVVIAQNMHEVVLNAMKSCREHEDLGPLARPRSSSTNSEGSSRPIATRRPIAIVSPQALPNIRDRCGSVPSRPRTISEGQESGARGYYTSPRNDSLMPFGMPIGRTISYSPPGMPNPLSPVSNTCSTDSAGSSLSIDDYEQTEFPYIRHMHSLPTEGALHTEPPIKEEQLDEYMPMFGGSTPSTIDDYLRMEPLSSSVPFGPSINLQLNAFEPTQLSSSLTTNLGNDYMEMNSPTEGYINMSPIGQSRDLTTNKSSSSLDAMIDHSVTKDGYIPMAPIRDPFSSMSSVQHDGYLDMAPLSSSLPKTFSVISNPSLSISSRKDSSSKLSDTPVSTPSSTNLDEFPLDKVKSLLADTDDSTCEAYIRPVRAYSMGSRPQPKKSHLPVHMDGSRIRAYSVGSQASTHRKNNPLDRELGNMLRIDPRTGMKSSSAPLLNNRPPRVRSSTSRGEVNEDLMEIDYNKAKYSSPAIDLTDSNFTIEPVGRSRSGSYSSTTSAMKRIQDREKSKSHSGCNPIKDNISSTSDYLSMSPIGDYKSPRNTLIENVAPKRLDHLHPSGDYVSLDPSSTYQSMKNNTVTDITTLVVNGTPYLRSSKVHSPSALESIADNTVKSIDSKTPSEYMCMSYASDATVQTPTARVANSHHSSPMPLTELNSNNQSQPPSVLSSPQSKSPPPQNCIPKTPPPSPCYGIAASALSGAPFVENVVRRLSQPSGEVRLNYASLDLPPPSEEDGKLLSGRLRKSLEGDTKEAPLTYAQIDFSPVKQKVLQDSDNLSHL